MKMFAIAFSLISFGSFAANNHWLLKKNSGGGFTPPEYVRSESCEVYEAQQDRGYKIVIERRFGELTSKQVKRVQANNLEAAIAKAAAEPLVATDNFICDAPATTIEAQISGDLPAFTLFYTGGCGAKEEDRQGFHTSNLKDFLNQFCPLTYDYDLN